MKWIEVSIKVPTELVEPLYEIFLRNSPSGVVVEAEGGYNPDEGEVGLDTEVVVTTYLPKNAKVTSRIAQIDIGVRLASLIVPLPPISKRTIEEKDWSESWKSHFQVFRVGKNFVIRPSWIEIRPNPNDLVITIDPGMAFGTGYHPTTRMALKALEETLKPGNRVLDLGTGTGILTIASAKLGASSVLALDIDPQAVEATQINVTLNRLDTPITVQKGTLPLIHNRSKSYPAFDLVIANISSKILIEKAYELAKATKNNGLLLAGGFIQERKPEVLDRLRNVGFQFKTEYIEDDWVQFLLQLNV